jgi:hypothetical protein
VTTTPRAPIRAVPNGLPARRIAEALFRDAEIRYVDGFDAIADRFDRFDDQRPSTCGAYAARYLLAPSGFAEHDGVDTTREDYLAWLAGTVLETHEVGPATAAGAEAKAAGLSDLEALRRFPRTFYGWPLRASDDPVVAGTSPTGVARAVAIASGGVLVTLPIAARRSDGTVVLDTPRMDAVHDLLAERRLDWRVHPIANYQAAQLLDPAAEAYEPANLVAADPTGSVPFDSWQVGHFAGIAAFWETGVGRRWVLLLDSYKGRGWAGYEPQPLELLRRGLVRSDRRDGGLLLVLPRERLDEAHEGLTALGTEIRMWGNGSLEPEGWRWELGR